MPNYDKYDEEENEHNIYNISHFAEKSNLSARISSLPRVLSDDFKKAFRHWKVLLFGQGISVCLTAIGASSSELYLNCGVNAPTAQYCLVYLLLSLHLLPILIRDKEWRQYIPRFLNERVMKRQIDEWNLETTLPTEDEDSVYDHHQHDENNPGGEDDRIYRIPILNVRIKGPLRLYFLMAFMDVEANFFTFLAFRYTTYTSITLLDALAIPGAMIASRILLKCNYRPYHILGALICVAGTTLNVFVDFEDVRKHQGDEEPGMFSNKLLGDLFAALGGLMYGVNDAVAELIVKNHDTQEYIGFTGFFGLIISVVQVFIFEKKEVANIFNDINTCGEWTSAGLLSVFLIANYLAFIGISRFLRISEAALLNLSLLTGDFYAVLFVVFWQHIIPQPLFFLAMIMIVYGVCLYESAPSPIATEDEPTNKTVLRDDADFAAVDGNFVTMEMEMKSKNNSSSATTSPVKIT